MTSTPEELARRWLRHQLRHMGDYEEELTASLASFFRTYANTIREEDAKVLEWKQYAHDASQADPVPDGFLDRMESAGFIEYVPVSQEILDSESFCEERGIEPGGVCWQPTALGRSHLEAIRGLKSPPVDSVRGA